MVAMSCGTTCRRGRRDPGAPGPHEVPRRARRCLRRHGGDPSEPVAVGRYYDPATGQFLSVDPKVQQTEQAYVYVHDPVNGSDSSGLMDVAGAANNTCIARHDCEVSGGIFSWIGRIVRNRLAQTIVLTVVGVAGAATGIGAVVELSLGAAEVAGTLGTVSTVLGFAGSAADLGQCVAGHDKNACTSAALDIVASALGVAGSRLTKAGAKIVGGIVTAKGFSIGFGGLAWGVLVGRW